jgi:hypothetical protein
LPSAGDSVVVLAMSVRDRHQDRHAPYARESAIVAMSRGVKNVLRLVRRAIFFPIQRVADAARSRRNHSNKQRGHPRLPAQPLEFVGVIASDGGSGRVEVLVTIKGCHDEPCQLVLNLSRRNRAALENELRHTLEVALRAHTVRQ